MSHSNLASSSSGALTATTGKVSFSEFVQVSTVPACLMKSSSQQVPNSDSSNVSCSQNSFEMNDTFRYEPLRPPAEITSHHQPVLSSTADSLRNNPHRYEQPMFLPSSSSHMVSTSIALMRRHPLSLSAHHQPSSCSSTSSMASSSPTPTLLSLDANNNGNAQNGQLSLSPRLLFGASCEPSTLQPQQPQVTINSSVYGSLSLPEVAFLQSNCSPQLPHQHHQLFGPTTMQHPFASGTIDQRGAPIKLHPYELASSPSLSARLTESELLLHQYLQTTNQLDTNLFNHLMINDQLGQFEQQQQQSNQIALTDFPLSSSNLISPPSPPASSSSTMFVIDDDACHKSAPIPAVSSYAQQTVGPGASMIISKSSSSETSDTNDSTQRLLPTVDQSSCAFQSSLLPIASSSPCSHDYASSIAHGSDSTSPPPQQSSEKQSMLEQDSLWTIVLPPTSPPSPPLETTKSSSKRSKQMKNDEFTFHQIGSGKLGLHLKPSTLRFLWKACLVTLALSVISGLLSVGYLNRWTILSKLGFASDSSDGLSKRYNIDTDPNWWRGATFYHIFPASFKDSNGDGYGDLAGITEQVYYLKSLGVVAVRLSSIFAALNYPHNRESILNFYAIDPHLGSFEDFIQMVRISITSFNHFNHHAFRFVD